MFSTHYFSFCTEIITKVYTHFPNLPKDFQTFQSITHLFLFLSNFPPDYTIPIQPSTIKECKRLLPLSITNDCYSYIIQSFHTFTQHIPHIDMSTFSTPTDYGFHTDLQNTITHILLTLLKRTTTLIHTSLITTKEARFISDICCPKLNTTEIVVSPSLQTKINDLCISEQLYVLPDALTIITACWEYIHSHPISLRICILEYIAKENENT